MTHINEPAGTILTQTVIHMMTNPTEKQAFGECLLPEESSSGHWIPKGRPLDSQDTARRKWADGVELPLLDSEDR